MSSTSFPASAGSASALKELGCEPSPSARSTPIAGPCCESTGQMSLFSETCESLPPNDYLLPTPCASDASHGHAGTWSMSQCNLHNIVLGKGKMPDGTLVKAANAKPWMSSAAASPARTFPSPEKARALKALARDYGASTPEL